MSIYLKREELLVEQPGQPIIDRVVLLLLDHSCTAVPAKEKEWLIKLTKLYPDWAKEFGLAEYIK